MDGVEVSGVWDTDPASRQEAETNYGIRGAVSLEDLLHRSDAVDVVTPTSSHYEIGLRIIEAKLPLFIEKPLCSTASEGRRLVERADDSGVILQVGHIERFNRAFRALQGVALQPRFIEVHRLSFWNPRGVDVAVVHDLMIHDLDLILTLAGDFPQDIHASGVSVVSDSIDIANARLEFNSGLVANLTASRISLKQMRKLRMFGSNEYITLDLAEGKCDYYGATADPAHIPADADILSELGVGSKARTLYRHNLQADEKDALLLQLEGFRDAIISGSKPPVSGADGLRALELAELIVNRIGER